jgi:hypothetical protein
LGALGSHAEIFQQKQINTLHKSKAKETTSTVTSTTSTTKNKSINKGEREKEQSFSAGQTSNYHPGCWMTVITDMCKHVIPMHISEEELNKNSAKQQGKKYHHLPQK